MPGLRDTDPYGLLRSTSYGFMPILPQSQNAQHPMSDLYLLPPVLSVLHNTMPGL